MNLIAKCLQLLQPAVTHDAIRMEVYLLGSRHRGEPLAGALAELEAKGLDPARSRLLRAVVDHLTRPRASRAT